MWANSKSFFRSWNVVERICFPAPKPSYTIRSFPEELILIPREDGEKVPCLFLPFKHARFLFIYFHANAEDLGLCYAFCKIIRDLFQVHMLAVEYPGYGICPGTPTEESIRANAFAASRFALETLNWPCDGIKLFGRSIGTGAALALAAENEMAGLILVTPFTSIRDIVRHQIGPLANLMSDRFPNIDLASKVESPTLIIHGQEDTLIPLSHSKAIYEAVPAKKMMVCPAAMEHNTSLLANVGTFVLPMTQFFSLPDYTFEDIEVPSWVYPHVGEELGEDQNSWSCAPSDWIAGTPRSVLADLRGGCLGASSPGMPLGARQESDTSTSDKTTPRRHQMTAPIARPGQVNSAVPESRIGNGHTPVVVASTPDMPLVNGDHASVEPGKKSLSATRQYDFRTPPATPRDTPLLRPSPAMMPPSRTSSQPCSQPPTVGGDPHVVDPNSGGLELVEENESDVAAGSDQDAKRIPDDMLQAIDTGITWMVDNDLDVGDLGNEEGTVAPQDESPDGFQNSPGHPECVPEHRGKSANTDKVLRETVPVLDGNVRAASK